MNIPYAAAWGVVSVERLIPCMNEKMLTRHNSMPQKPKSAIIAAFPYAAGGNDGNIARFARVTDYHEVVYRHMLKVAEGMTGCTAVKNGWPLPLVYAAQLAGVGFTGCHGLQIVEPYGSYVALGAILCEKEAAGVRNTTPSRCALCRKCERACPTGAMLFEGGRRVLNRELCIASITQSKRPEKLELLSKSKYIWGCDICQEVCPYNAESARTTVPEFLDGVVSGFDGGVPELPARHYSGREELLRRNMSTIAAVNSAAQTTTTPSTNQTFSTTPN